MDAQIDRLPPQNLEAEASVLGSLMLDKDAIIKIADILHSDDFYDEKNKSIYLAMLELYEKSVSIDILTVSNILDEQKKLEFVGGSSYLANMVNSVPTAAHVTHYASIVRRKGTLRRLIQAANEITNLGYKDEADIESVLDQSEQKLFNVSQKFMKQNFVPLTQVLHETFERLDDLHKNKGKLRGVATGYLDLDNKLGGLQKSDLVILAARPSMGKTSLALDIARNVAINTKQAVGIFSLEMSKDQLVDRLLSAEAEVNLWKLRTGHLSDEGPNNDFHRIADAMAKLSEAPLYIDDTAGSSVMEIRTKARRLQAEQDLGLIVIDYLQLMQGRTTNSDNRVQEVSEISRSLKGLARELNVPVLALSQLNRAVETRPDKRPLLADLRESGSIEQDADVVLFIYREDMYKGKESDKPNIAEIHIAKHRNGPTGKVELYFDSEKTSFRNLDKSFSETLPQPADMTNLNNQDTDF
ncbi:replicative DNA helicase [Patescibacteria group bacterium]|nr:replicative DNA helicase [Patescibacteria group bacterium]